MVGVWMSKDVAVALQLAQVMRYVMSVLCLWYYVPASRWKPQHISCCLGTVINSLVMMLPREQSCHALLPFKPQKL